MKRRNTPGISKHSRIGILTRLSLSTLFIITIFIPGRFGISKGNSENGNNDSLNFIKAFSLPAQIDTVSGLLIREQQIRAGLLYDMNNNKIVWGKDIFTPYPIASLTKMMVALITVEDLKSGKFDWDTKLKVTREASLVGGSKVFLKTGQNYSVNDLLHASMIASGNDACYLLAQWNGGTEKAFVERMNKRAAELGMKTTRFSNSTGMPAYRGERDNFSTPHDLLILATELLKYDELVNIACKPNECIQQGYRTFVMRNHNGLVKEYTEVNGLKTGWTNNAGYCIVATANRAGHQMISIVLGAPRVITRNSIVASMLNDYFQTIGLGRMGELTDSTFTEKMAENFEDSSN